MNSSNDIFETLYRGRAQYRVLHRAVRMGWVRAIRNFAGGDFFTGRLEPQDGWFWWFKPFSKLKTAFCEYWTSIIIKISMIYVSKVSGQFMASLTQNYWSLYLIIHCKDFFEMFSMEEHKS